MKKFIKTLLSPSARSTAIYYFGNFILSIGRYFFHLILLRFLSPSEYGEFLSYLSLTYLLGIPMSTLGSVVTKYVAEYHGHNDKKSINQFFYYLLKKASPVTILLGASLLIFSNQLAIVFKAHSIAFIVLGISILFSIFQTISSSYLAAFQKFISQTILGYLNVFLTIVFSVLFINMRLGATGAVLGQLSSVVIVTLITFWIIKDSIFPKDQNQVEPKFDIKNFTNYSLLYAIGSTSLISTDVLLVRSLYDPTSSGLYSSLSILGRMILFGLTPLSVIALPIATNRYVKTGSARSILIKLGSVMSLFGTLGVLIFSLFPSLAVNLLSGHQYLDAAPFLGIFSLSMLFFALSQFLLSYLMATGRPSANLILLIATILQPILFFVLPKRLSTGVNISIGLEAFLFISLIFFLFKKRSSN